MGDAGGIEFTDRYQALGIRPPSLLTVCGGQCEGTGVVPVYLPEGDESLSKPGGIVQLDAAEEDHELAARWHLAESRKPCRDGWHFVTCPGCEGTGRQPGPGWLVSARRLPGALRRKCRFARYYVFSSAAWRKDVPHPALFNLRIALRILLRSW